MDINYIILTTIVLLAIIIYIKSGFWANQPVFHAYDLGYYLSSEVIIPQKWPPAMTRWVNLPAVQTKEWVDMSEAEKENVAAFLRREYHNNGLGNAFRPTVKKHLDPYLAEGGLISWHGSKGLIITRPIILTLGGQTMTAYYCDYLCVAAEYRKHGIAPTLIQTHEYRQRTPSAQISLFRREGESTGMVRPLMCQTAKLVRITETTGHQPLKESDIMLIAEKMQTAIKNKDVSAMVSTGTLKGLIKSGTWRVYEGNNGLEIYRDTGMEWNGEEIKELLLGKGGCEGGWVVMTHGQWDTSLVKKGVVEWEERVEWILYNGVYRCKGAASGGMLL